MSLDSWCEEFYPTPADEAAEDPIAHSLRKWIGLREENLRKHDVLLLGRFLEDEAANSLEINARNCALCQVFYKDVDDEEARCKTCPLAIVRGGVACDSWRYNEDVNPFAALSFYKNPEPMILWLQRAQIGTVYPNEEPPSGDRKRTR